MEETRSVMDRVRAALGRTGPLAAAPSPPAIPEPVVRLVHTELGLAELFAGKAAENKIGVEAVGPEDLASRVAAFLAGRGCKKVAMAASAALEKLGLAAALRGAGLDAAAWDRMTLEELYDYDCSVTDVYCAVAETGSLVIRNTPGHGKSLSLVPAIHVAVVRPADLVADLIDLFEKLTRDGVGSNVVIISGPSKTSDIEMTLVTGVHGPQTVQVFLLK